MRWSTWAWVRYNLPTLLILSESERSPRRVPTRNALGSEGMPDGFQFWADFGAQSCFSDLPRTKGSSVRSILIAKSGGDDPLGIGRSSASADVMALSGFAFTIRQGWPEHAEIL